jgi:hypothetical protein
VVERLLQTSETGNRLVTPKSGIDKVLLSDDSWETLDNVIIFTSVASNREEQTFGVKKRSCFVESDLDLIKNYQFEHRTNSNFCEIFVESRLVIIFMRVSTDSQLAFHNLAPGLFRQIYTPIVPQFEPHLLPDSQLLGGSPLIKLKAKNKSHHSPDLQSNVSSLETLIRKAQWDLVANFIADQYFPLELLGLLPVSLPSKILFIFILV